MFGVRRLVHFNNFATADESLDYGDGSYRAIRLGQLQVQLSAIKKALLASSAENK